MRFHQVLNEDLGCASYLIADGGEAIVVDPRWDVDVYERLAARAGARITHVVDTHDHADHVSGRGRLARRTGAAAHRPARDGGRRPGDLEAGDELRAGAVRLVAMATPGHRPEHLSLVVHDDTRSPAPWALLAGDSLLVGGVARPDLAVDAQAGARELHESLARIHELGDHVELWPAHIGGSLCGGAGLSAKTSSTVGFERRARGVAALARERFVAEVAGDLPPRPAHVASVVARNRGPLDEEPAEFAVLDARGVRGALAAGAMVIDARAPARFDTGHLAGALCAAPGPGLGTRVGWAVTPGAPLVVVAADLRLAREVVGALHAVGVWDVVGIAQADVAAWRDEGLAVARGAAWDTGELARRLREGAARLVDVRTPAEHARGHVPGSVLLPLHELGDGRRCPAGRPLAVACAAGGRAALAASVLRRAGHADVVRVEGGVADLAAHGIELAAA